MQNIVYFRNIRNPRPQLDPVAGSMNKIAPSVSIVVWGQEEKSGGKRFLRGSRKRKRKRKS